MTSTLRRAPDSRHPLVAGRQPLRVGPFSAVWRFRSLVLLFSGVIALFTLLVLNLAIGDYNVALMQVVGVLFGGGDSADQVVIFELRMPRSLTGLLVGATLGLSGAVIQTIARNPLASPDILGITWGAGTAATAVIVTGGTVGAVSGATASVGLPIVALLGGMLSGLAVFLLAYRNGLDPFRLVLVGIGVMTMTGNATFWLLSLGEVNDAGRALVWLTGSLSGRGWENVVPVACALIVLVPPILVGAHALGTLQLDDDSVRAVGVRLNFVRATMLLAATMLAAIATAAAGPIQFVALCAPHIAMRLAQLSRPPIVSSMVLAAVLVTGADLISRTAFGGLEMPVGIVTAILGAPYLIYLLVHPYREAAA